MTSHDFTISARIVLPFTMFVYNFNMIRFFTRYACKKLSLSSYERTLLTHGLDIAVCDGLTILTALLVSYSANQLYAGIAYTVSFSILRSHSGGWHAPNRLLCFFSYHAVFSLMLLLCRFSFAIYGGLILLIPASSYTIDNAPIEHILCPLSPEEYLHNHNKVISHLCMTFIVCLILSCIHPDTAFAICYAIVWNAVCMALLKHSDNWRYHDHSMRNHR